ncbi:hypothetical protein [Pseudomonas sp. BNK-15]|uniref:hypothetical protein n=1 Tax=Pseudomonas sp. BNK-15 TaxID=3376152 RepID=UPI0039BFBE37
MSTETPKDAPIGPFERLALYTAVGIYAPSEADLEAAAVRLAVAELAADPGTTIH